MGGLMQANKWTLLSASGIVLVTLALTGCGGYGSPTDPGAPAGPEGAVVTITSTGVEPKTVTIAVGQSVTFVNNDDIAHDMASDPYPQYTDCPAVNRVGSLAAGQRMQTGALTVARACGYLDLLRNADVRWQGTIIVQ
jgi:plastocyanin